MVGASGLAQCQLVVVVFRVGAEEATAVIEALVSDSQPHDACVEVAHIHEIITDDSDVS